MRHAAIAAALLALLPVARLEAQSNRSLTDSENRILLAQGATITVPEPGASEDENVQALQEQILLLRSAIRSLTESLAISNSEAETFKRQATDLTLKIEALGIPDAQNDRGKLEQKLLAAVRDLRLLKNSTRPPLISSSALRKPSRSCSRAPRKSILRRGSQSRPSFARRTRSWALRTARKHAAQSKLPSTMEWSDVKDDLALVVANIGEKQGVRVGMPFPSLARGQTHRRSTRR